MRCPSLGRASAQVAGTAAAVAAPVGPHPGVTARFIVRRCLAGLVALGLCSAQSLWAGDKHQRISSDHLSATLVGYRGGYYIEHGIDRLRDPHTPTARAANALLRDLNQAFATDITARMEEKRLRLGLPEAKVEHPILGTFRAAADNLDAYTFIASAVSLPERGSRGEDLLIKPVTMFRVYPLMADGISPPAREAIDFLTSILGDSAAKMLKDTPDRALELLHKAGRDVEVHRRPGDEAIPPDVLALFDPELTEQPVWNVASVFVAHGQRLVEDITIYRLVPFLQQLFPEEAGRRRGRFETRCFLDVFFDRVRAYTIGYGTRPVLSWLVDNAAMIYNTKRYYLVGEAEELVKRLEKRYGRLHVGADGQLPEHEVIRELDPEETAAVIHQKRLPADAAEAIAADLLRQRADSADQGEE